MPRLRRREKRKSHRFTEGHRRQLVSGHDMFGDAYGRVGRRPSRRPFDPEAAREGWEQHRDEIMAEYVAAEPGSRPFAWWVFDSPIGDALLKNIADNEMKGVFPWFGDWMEDNGDWIKHRYCFDPDDLRCDPGDDDTRLYERPVEYLQRIGELRDGEFVEHERRQKAESDEWVRRGESTNATA